MRSKTLGEIPSPLPIAAIVVGEALTNKPPAAFCQRQEHGGKKNFSYFP